jgi:peptidoglycan hydrolase CwlO-like protein
MKKSLALKWACGVLAFSCLFGGIIKLNVDTTRVLNNQNSILIVEQNIDSKQSVLEDKIVLIQNSIEAISTQMESIKGDTTSLKNTVSSLSATLTNLQEQIKFLQDNASILESNDDEFAEKLTALQDKVAIVESKINTLSNLQADISNALSAIKAKQDEMAEAETFSAQDIASKLASIVANQTDIIQKQEAINAILNENSMTIQRIKAEDTDGYSYFGLHVDQLSDSKGNPILDADGNRQGKLDWYGEVAAVAPVGFAGTRTYEIEIDDAASRYIHFDSTEAGEHYVSPTHLSGYEWKDGENVVLPKIDFDNTQSPATYSSFVTMSKAFADNYIRFIFNGTIAYALIQAGVKLV